MNKKFMITSALSVIIFVSLGLFNARTSNNELGFTWYAMLEKAPLTPPNFVFGIAWTILYVLMGVSFSFLLCAKPYKENIIARKYFNLALIFFIVQFIVNLIWSYMFWTFRNPFLALINIIILDILVPITIVLVCKVSKKSAIFLIPYMLWISFATYLNLYMVLYN